MYLNNLPLFLALTVSQLTAQEPASVETQSPVKNEAPKSVTPPIPVSEISRFVNVYQLIRNRYVEEIPADQLIDNAIKGMLSELDPYSRYIASDEMQDFNNENNGSFVGIGISADISTRKLLIASVFKGSPADKAGLQADDIISKVNGTPVTKQNVQVSLDALKGEAGSEVKLTIQREGEESFEVSITRAPVNLPSIEAQMLKEANLLHLRIYQFTRDTGKEARDALTLNHDAKGVILDLRDNPGGTIVSALEVADMFLKQGLIVSTKERNTGQLKKVHATKQLNDSDLPLIVMMNSGSASASELVAGALQDQKRALIVGQKSYGKGSVQSIFPTEDKGAIKLTISRYYTPNGRAIQAKGIVPDIVLTPLSAKPVLESPDDYYEADLSNHISGEEYKPAKPKKDEPSESKQTPNKKSEQIQQNIDDTKPKKVVNKTQKPNKLANVDLELYEAVNIMKALQFSKTQ